MESYKGVTLSSFRRVDFALFSIWAHISWHICEKVNSLICYREFTYHRTVEQPRLEGPSKDQPVQPSMRKGSLDDYCAPCPTVSWMQSNIQNHAARLSLHSAFCSVSKLQSNRQEWWPYPARSSALMLLLIPSSELEVEDTSQRLLFSDRVWLKWYREKCVPSTRCL